MRRARERYPCMGRIDGGNSDLKLKMRDSGRKLRRGWATEVAERNNHLPISTFRGPGETNGHADRNAMTAVPASIHFAAGKLRGAPNARKASGVPVPSAARGGPTHRSVHIGHPGPKHNARDPRLCAPPSPAVCLFGDAHQATGPSEATLQTYDMIPQPAKAEKFNRRNAATNITERPLNGPIRAWRCAPSCP